MAEYKTPDSIKINQWATQFRYGLILLAGFGFGGTWAKSILNLTDEQLTGYVAGAVTTVSFIAWVVPAGYGWLRNRMVRGEIKDVVVASTITSAATGVPTQVEVVQTPAGQNNVVVHSLIPSADIQKSTADLNLEELARHGG